ncbi:MAG: hypothetical protein PHG96_13755 [Kiritimatiellae bacterium]|nr:hypothetical protein [Kiritimatiellia bacterium]MDD3546405.1 hypothetical protein [Kiritimatiellia bacterium]MDD4026371.1 hypothetical protein [Kiritimatiellia bacterium]MDD4623108.1 hypothetical protein [Kiritimatiellia bacterium]
MKAGSVGVFLLGLCGFAPIEMFASDVVEVGIGEIGYVGTNGVSETLSHSILIEGELRKVGAGTNDVPAGRLISAQGRVTLVEGGLRVETGGTPETVAAPAEILAQAAMWFSADTTAGSGWRGMTPPPTACRQRCITCLLFTRVLSSTAGCSGMTALCRISISATR